MDASKACLASLLLLLVCVSWGRATQGENSCYPDVPCDDGDCISRDLWCDKFPDCYDDSDEQYCKKNGVFLSANNKCNGTLHFLCANGRCVPKVLECDGFDDCEDESDEKNCVESEGDGDPEHEERRTTQETVSTPSFPPVGRGDVPFPDSLTTQTPVIDARVDSTRGNGPDPRVSTTPVSPHQYDRRENVPDPRATQPPYTPYDYHGGGNVPDPRATQPPFNPYDYHGRGNVPDPRATQPPFYPYDYNGRGNVPDPRFTPPPYTPYDYHGRGNVPDPRATQPPFHPYGRGNVPYPRGHHGPIPEPTLRRAWPLPAFRFEEDRQRSFGRRYGGALSGAERWLLSQEVTPRVLVALSLARSSFRPNTTQYEVTRRRLKLQLGAKLLKHPLNPLNVHELSTYINALLATCQDPRQVYGLDLVSMLQNSSRSRTAPSPSVLLTLCLANASVADQDFGLLRHAVDSPIVDDISKDRFILSTSALACIHKRGLYANELRSVLGAASRKLLDLQYDDGSFGSLYSTALATQALFALDTNAWNPDETLDYVLRHQSADGSFGDMLATYYIVPILGGRSLLHLRETECEKPKEEASPEAFDRIYSGRTKTVWYTLSTGQERITQPVTVPDDANFFEVMQEAQKLHPRFRFLYTETFGRLNVYTLSNVPNDPERGTYWQLFVPDRNGNGNRIYEGDIRQLIPGDKEELLYSYLPHRSSSPIDLTHYQPKQIAIIMD